MTITTAISKSEFYAIAECYLSEAMIDLTVPSIRDFCYGTIGNMGLDAVRDELEEFHLSDAEEVSLLEQLKDEIYEVEIESLDLYEVEDGFIDAEVTFACDIKDVVSKVRKEDR